MAWPLFGRAYLWASSPPGTRLALVEVHVSAWREGGSSHHTSRPPSPGTFQEEINLKDKWGLEQSAQQCFQTKSKQLFIKGQIAGR